MKVILRYFLINTLSLLLTTEIVRGVSYTGGIRTLIIGGLVFTAINLILVPLLKILFLPLNLLTLGLFGGIINVLALYSLTKFVPQFNLVPYQIPPFYYAGFTTPEINLSVFWVAVLASVLIWVITHSLHWLIR